MGKLHLNTKLNSSEYQLLAETHLYSLLHRK